jgi:hypothetical protein
MTNTPQIAEPDIGFPCSVIVQTATDTAQPGQLPEVELLFHQLRES